jgi:hypothetical protein
MQSIPVNNEHSTPQKGWYKGLQKRNSIRKTTNPYK